MCLNQKLHIILGLVTTKVSSTFITRDNMSKAFLDNRILEIVNPLKSNNNYNYLFLTSIWQKKNSK